MLQITELIAKYYHMNSGIITVRCDSNAALGSTVLNDFIFKKVRPRVCILILVNSIYNVITSMSLTVLDMKFDDYKDNEVPSSRLTLYGKRNIEIYNLAKTYMRQHHIGYVMQLSTCN